MRLTLCQKEKLQSLFKTIELLFNHEKYGLMYTEIIEAWVVGPVLTDYLLFKNPISSVYDFYLQVDNEQDIYPWLSHLAQNEINFEVNKALLFDDNVINIIEINDAKLEIDEKINIIVGKSDPEDFIINNYPATIYHVGFDIGKLFVWLSRHYSVEKIVASFWRSASFNKDIKSKKINIVTPKGIKTAKQYTELEKHLEILYAKLSSLGFK